MSTPLTPDEIQNLVIQVTSFARLSDTQRLVGISVKFENEQKEFNVTVDVPKNSKKLSRAIVADAVRSIKQEIKAFVKNRGESIVGNQLAFDNEFWV